MVAAVAMVDTIVGWKVVDWVARVGKAVGMRLTVHRVVDCIVGLGGTMVVGASVVVVVVVVVVGGGVVGDGVGCFQGFYCCSKLTDR